MLKVPKTYSWPDVRYDQWLSSVKSEGWESKLIQTLKGKEEDGIRMLYIIKA